MLDPKQATTGGGRQVRAMDRQVTALKALCCEVSIIPSFGCRRKFAKPMGRCLGVSCNWGGCSHAHRPPGRCPLPLGTAGRNRAAWAPVRDRPGGVPEPARVVRQRLQIIGFFDTIIRAICASNSISRLLRPCSEKRVVTTDDEKLDAAVVAGLYVQHAVNLERFLVGVLGDRDQAKDVLQVAFARLIEQGHRVCVDSQKAWLYQVAYREALAARRRDARTSRILPRVARMRAKSELMPETTLLRREAVEAVRQALSRAAVGTGRVGEAADLRRKNVCGDCRGSSDSTRDRAGPHACGNEQVAHGSARTR